MKRGVSPISGQESAFWDIFLLKNDGEWMGVRAPWFSLRRVLTLLALLLALSAVGVTGWLLSRWQAGRLDRMLSLERLKSAALEAQLNDLRKTSNVTSGEALAVPAGAAATLLPSLGGEDLTSGSVQLEDPQAGYDPVSRDFHLSFELVRQGPRDGAARFYWTSLLHGPAGVLSYPAGLFASRAGDALQFHKGQALDEVRIRRSVSARFKIREFFESAGTEPVYATILVFDGKGSLLLRKRLEIAFQRAAQPEKEGR